MRKQYYYWLYDKKTGDLLYEGTARELVEHGAYDTVRDVSIQYQMYMKGRACKYDMEREKVTDEDIIQTPFDRETEWQMEQEKLGQLQSRWVNVYTCYDKDGQVIAEGTAQKIAELGLFENANDVRKSFLYCGGKNEKRGVERMDMIRQLQCYRVGNAVESVEKADAGGAPLLPQPQKRRRKLTKDDEDELARDVRQLCKYNKLAAKAHKKVLSYGYWAAAGKPARP